MHPDNILTTSERPPVTEYNFYNEMKRIDSTISKKVLQQQIAGSSFFAANMKIQKHYVVQKRVCERDWTTWNDSLSQRLCTHFPPRPMRQSTAC